MFHCSSSFLRSLEPNTEAENSHSHSHSHSHSCSCSCSCSSSSSSSSLWRPSSIFWAFASRRGPKFPQLLFWHCDTETSTHTRTSTTTSTSTNRQLRNWV